MSKKKILVVDDEVNVIKVLAFVLNKEGYDVDSAGNGEEAVVKVAESKPDLIFLDVMMPRKNGYEVCREIRSNPDLNDVHIIMLSAKGQEEDRQEGFSAGANEVITKPFSPQKIIDRTRELLG